MILLEHAHVAPGVGVAQLDSVPPEQLRDGARRRQRSVVDRGPGPIEDDSFQVHPRISIRVFSAIPNDNVIPEPPGEVTIRTPGAGSRDKYGFSGCLA